MICSLTGPVSRSPPSGPDSVSSRIGSRARPSPGTPCPRGQTARTDPRAHPGHGPDPVARLHYARGHDPLAQMSAVETAAAVRARTLSAEEVVAAAALERAEAAQAAYNRFVAIRRQEALTEARAIDAGGPWHDGPLAGVPLSQDRVRRRRGLVTTLGGRGNTTPAQADSEMVRRLRAAGRW